MTREPAKLITLRLGKGLLRDLKLLAALKGVRYQTLIKRVLADALKERA